MLWSAVPGGLRLFLNLWPAMGECRGLPRGEFRGLDRGLARGLSRLLRAHEPATLAVIGFMVREKQVLLRNQRWSFVFVAVISSGFGDVCLNTTFAERSALNGDNQLRLATTPTTKYPFLSSIFFLSLVYWVVVFGATVTTISAYPLILFYPK